MIRRNAHPRAPRRRPVLALASGTRVGRSAPEGAPPAPSPAAPPPLLPQAQQPPPAPAHQQLTLYVGGALVVLIVLVIILLSSRVQRRALTFVPKGQSVVQVVDVGRFLRGPAYRVLAKAQHPVARHLESVEDAYNVSLRHDVAVVIDTDDSTILIGRFRPERLRDRFEETIETKEKELSRDRRAAVHLEILEGDVEGYKYLYCNQEGVDRAFAPLGSSAVCIGGRWGVRRFLKTQAGLRDRALDDEPFKAAYSAALARRAFLYRLETPDGTVLAARLKGVLGASAPAVQATFLALGESDKAIGLTLRFAAESKDAAAALAASHAEPGAPEALRPQLGAATPPKVTCEGAVVVLESSLPLKEFEAIVAAEQKPESDNLVLTVHNH